MRYGLTPSAEEFTGYYNVPEPKRRGKRKQAYLHTVDSLPILILDEATEMARAALDVVCSYANQYDFSSDELRNYYWGSTSCVQLDDRTFNIILEPNDYTFDLIKRLQMFLLSEYYLWRIRIVGSTNATTIMVYPSNVRYGSLSDNFDEEQALSTIIECLITDEPRSRQIAKAHLEMVKRLAGDAIRSGFSERVKILVGFNNYEGDFNEVTIWTVCKKDTPELSLPPTMEFMIANQYYAKNDGVVGPHVTDDAPFSVQEWIFPGRNLPARLPFLVSDANYQISVLEIDVKPIRFVQEALR